MNAVHESENSENAPSRGAAPPRHEARLLSDYGRQIQHDAYALTSTVQDVTTGVEGYLTARVTGHPYGTLGVAAGIGYVLGGGLSSRLTAALLGTATRLAMALAARELGARLLPKER